MPMFMNPHWNPEVLYHMTAPVNGVFDIAGLDLTGYQRVAVYMEGIKAEVDGVNLHMHVYIDGGLRVLDHEWRSVVGSTSAGGDGAEGFSSAGTAYGILSGGSFGVLGNAAAESFSGRLEFSVPAGKYSHFSLTGYAIQPNGSGAWVSAAGYYQETGRLTGFALVPHGGGLLTAGTVTVLAVKKALGRAPDPIQPDVQSLWTGAVA